MDKRGSSRVKIADITPTTDIDSDAVSKWLPFVFAGGAIGIALFALREIKNTKNEILNMKSDNGSKLIEKKMEILEEQLKGISDHLKISSNKPQPRHIPPKAKKVVLVEPEPQQEINIINDEDEYEEVEVTDDDEES
jgi:hypothetical protein